MKIVICDYPVEMQRDLSYEVGLLKNAFPKGEIVLADYISEEKFLRDMQGAAALITAFVPLSAGVLSQLKDLKLISINAAGYDTVDLKGAKQAGIQVTNVADYCTEEVATHTLSVLLALSRHLKAYDRTVNNDKCWQFQSQLGLKRLSRCTLAIFGWGKISKQVARLAKGFGMNILVVSEHLKSAEAAKAGVRLVDKKTAFKEADIIANHMRQTLEKHHYFSREAFTMMAKQPIFLNMGRGEAVDEAELVKALDSGLLSGAGLDVLESAQPDLINSRLLNRDNVIITPHAAFYSEDSLKELAYKSCEHVIRYFQGERETLPLL